MKCLFKGFIISRIVFVVDQNDCMQTGTLNNEGKEFLNTPFYYKDKSMPFGLDYFYEYYGDNLNLWH